MKKLLIVIFIIGTGILLNAQEECLDAVHPTEGKNIIFNCCIDEVKYGNVVFYTKGGESQVIQAIAITKDGQYIKLEKYESTQEDEIEPIIENDGLYKGHDFNYYKVLFHKANSQKKIGVFLTIIGFGLEIAGTVMISDNTSANDYTGAALYVSGFIAFNVGVPLWIAGGIKRKNNKRAMEETKKGLNLSIKNTEYGIGLVMNF